MSHLLARVCVPLGLNIKDILEKKQNKNCTKETL